MRSNGAAPVDGERKPVTALFADLVGSTQLADTLDPEDWAEIVNGLYAVVSAAITRYGGTITQLSGDAVVALFGAPTAHEDDPERAVRAALDLIAAVDDLSERLGDAVGAPLQMRVGVNTGLAVVGRVGAPEHEEYTALGDAMNVAARMQSAAHPGSVLVTQATHERVVDLVDSTDLGAIEVKGKSEPVRAFEITSIRRGTRPRGIPGLRSPMVGRESELARLESLLDTVAAGRGRAALVLGEPGIGKSRLVQELRTRADGRTWIEGRCLSFGHSLPYHLIADLVRSIAAEDGDEVVDGQSVTKRVRELLDGQADEVAAHLSHLLGLPADPSVTERLAELEPSAVRSRYVEALRTTLTALTKSGPVVVVCEDIHWADAASVGMLIDLLGVVHTAPVLLVVTTRPDRDADGWQLVMDAQVTLGEALVQVHLDPLASADARSLVGHLLEIESLPEHVRTTILRRTDGNPFFLEEVVRTLIDQGFIDRRGDRWVAVEDVEAVEVPDSLHALILSRIDRLSGDALRCLQLASVVGREFTVPLLEMIGGPDGTGSVALSLGELEAHGLVEITRTRPELVYAFRHALVQEAAYDRLLRRERQELHGLVADCLESMGDEALSDAALLAHHLSAAGETDRAVPYLLEAGRKALARYANREAVALFGRAREFLSGRSDEGSLRQIVEAGLGEIEAGFSFVPGGEELALLGELLPSAEALGDERLLARVHFWVGWTRHSMGEWFAKSPQLRESIERAHELGSRLGDETLVALPLGVIASSKYAAGRYRESIADGSRAVEILQRRERFADASIFAGTVAMAYALLGEFASADDWMQRTVVLAEKSGDPNAHLDADLAFGFVESERGNLLEAMEYTRRAIEQANEIGNIACALVGSFLLGDQHLQLGEVEAAIPALERSSELAAYCDAGSFATLSDAWLAAARSKLGAEGQDGDFEVSLATARSNGDTLGEAEIRRHRATILAGAKDADWSTVVADFEYAVDAFTRLGARPRLARTLKDYGMALEIVGRHDEANDVLVRAAQISDDLAAGVGP